MSDAPASSLKDRPQLGPEGQSCAECAAGFFRDGQDMGGCRLNPPTITHLVLPRLNILSKQVESDVQPWASWPAVKRDQWCVSGFRPKTKQ